MNTQPFTQEEYLQLQEIVIPIREYVPGNHLHFIWDAYKRIEGRHEPQPCNCGSAGHHWAKAVTTIKEFITKTEENNK